ncbi:Protein kinase domain-containing protein [Mucor velutinosus]|uniref:Protein kinase domain-containing protein n=1 Tax=Mucor velutinosus TaxID=708070 RepID=A0AAN7HVW1_9FUNG|nr:Protein kinase domain-containing protein [Mucor velutinosus]
MKLLLTRAAGVTTSKSITSSLVSKRLHSTGLVAAMLPASQSRLRLEEDRYCQNLSTPIKQPYQGVLKALAKKTESDFRNAHMMVSETQGKLLHQLVSILRPANVLEIGGFTGYSAIAMASALAPKAKLLSLELDPKHIEVAEQFVNQAQLQDKILFKQGPALDSLSYLGQENPASTQYDLIFLDADKAGYIQYFDSIMEHDLLSDRGIILVDNVLFFGHVHTQAADYVSQAPNKDSSNGEEGTRNLRKTALKVHHFNQHVAKDPRVESVMLPVFDGLTIIRKKV